MNYESPLELTDDNYDSTHCPKCEKLRKIHFPDDVRCEDHEKR